MSLNPADSQRRGRSRSPGRRDDDRDHSRGRYEEEVHERERSRVVIDRAPSPPKSRYDDPRESRGRYEYEEETVTRTSKGRPDRDEVRYTSSRKYRSDSESSVSPDTRPSRSMPGEFKHVEEEVKVRYGDRKEKEYYEERRYSKKDEYKPESPKDRYAKTEKYRYADADPRDRDSHRYDEESKSRDRGSSINVSGSFSVGHGDSPKREYARPTSPKYGSSYTDPKKWEYAPPVVVDSSTSQGRLQLVSRSSSPGVTNDRNGHPTAWELRLALDCWPLSKKGGGKQHQIQRRHC